MPPQKIAIIGTGIAGLGCAYFLHSKSDITLYDKNDHVGGHVHTVTVHENGVSIPIDTGFMVYNEVTYPALTRLFRELGVITQPTSMSFSVTHAPRELEYSGSSMNHLFAQRRNLFNFKFIRMLRQIGRFNRDALKVLSDPRYESYTVKQFVEERHYGSDFLNCYLIPMSSAVWSTPPDLMLEFPALTLIRFFHNHGFLGLHTQHPWRTVAGGSQTYVAQLVRPFRDKIHLRRNVLSVNRAEHAVTIASADGKQEKYDAVIFATHADEALRILSDPTPEERDLLSKFKYQKNRAILHSDETVMPKTKLCWSSWNYRIEDSPSTHYWMNSLQRVSHRKNYFVSLNYFRISPDKKLKEIEFEHPLFNLEAIRAQKELPQLNRLSPNQTTYFCGSYFRYGFHEDALQSSIELCRQILGKPLWN